ncbi:MAG: YceI family protein, partial [Dokdonella sp.]
DLSSVTTGDSDRDGALPGDEFFNVDKFPKAHFVSRRFRQDGKQVIADGTLTMKGVSKPVSLAVTVNPAVTGATMSVTSELNRLDFNVGSGDYADTSTIGETIKVDAQLKLAEK